MASLKEQLNGRMDNVLTEMAHKCGVHDMRLNFKKLNDMLYIKFKQLEDTKSGLRDVLTYQKYFYPLQMQAAINENLQNLESAMADQGYVSYTKNKFTSLTDDIDKMKARCAHIQDTDLI